MAQKIALINTNRYLKPPVPPVGIEYLLAPLSQAGHKIETLDLAFEDNPVSKLISFLEESKPTLVGFSVRNLDVSTYPPKFLLGEIPRLIGAAREVNGAKLVAGGSATLCASLGLKDYLGVDSLILGPGEKAMVQAADRLEGGEELPPLVDGWEAGIASNIVHTRGRAIDYQPYLQRESFFGIEFQKGCPGSCEFCVERKKPLLTREIENFLKELSSLVALGVKSIFICDSEVNLDEKGALHLFEAIERLGLDIEWTGYFRPSPFDKKMADGALHSGCKSLTLSVNSWELWNEGINGGKAVKNFVELCRERGIKVAIDLMVGMLGETRESIEKTIELFQKLRPETVGINPYFRLYSTTPMAHLASQGRSNPNLIGEIEDNDSLIKPIFYAPTDINWLKSLLDSDPLFVLEGKESTVNYQRI
ncbi:MAG: radical SAM protein [Actinomycetota bacterium]|nr:radical SAM protein [Actinomycetota bacterium]